jgi:drug/metabolite transporter (DMT)-like permease
MKALQHNNQVAVGIVLAIIATGIWGGNFVIARGVNQLVPPVTLAFYRWSCASLIIFPIGLRAFGKDWPVVRRHPWHFFFAALSGISLFNTFIYVGGHYSTAINLALIGTTSSPVFSFILSAIFLKEYIPPRRITGLLICLAGILVLLSKGSWQTLMHFRFTPGDWWILMAALSFAIYNVIARRKPTGVSPKTYLFAVFILGTLLLLPAWLVERSATPPVVHTANLGLIILYLGAGTSVISFLCWNAAIARLGAARTALFGNLTPIFSTIEAVLLLGEQISSYHIAGMVTIITGLVIANTITARSKPAQAKQKE